MSDRFCGFVLAAGAGTRFGGPKALVRTADGTPWIHRAVAALRDGGCDDVLVGVGADADRAEVLVPADALPVRVSEWREGVAATLRAGLTAAAHTGADAVVVVTVDTPDLPSAAVGRLIASSGAEASRVLLQATYDGVPGHPVVIGRDHWSAVAATVAGDAGARTYLRAHGAGVVECGDLWSGDDIDVPE
ncbi:nucleotidyltransferase family protein [Microbacterium ulmi]|uniref:NTP transferase domain-containing protein n=1 Tax=Microbacterium ulmi TaxID=179095 RepID=A0A7Y2Q0Q2_9MICO|nr:NTP transferase domain-containing protein [Microbacterium ulmi]NII69590.1 molybdenum cofactor cytidylyltransferase/nicotine blue oxidoreductase [Microbacterium ulmi]NNH03522.1 NTP transferase domain-containing protein [Microbacterium ulmi]